MWVDYNPNPMGRRVEDCSIRAVSKALDVDWETAYAMVTAAGFAMGDMPHSNAVWGSTLRRHGFYRKTLPETCPDCYTAEDFGKDHPKGVFVLGFGQHVATMVDGILFDSWNSSQLNPQYFWYKQEV